MIYIFTHYDVLNHIVDMLSHTLLEYNIEHTICNNQNIINYILNVKDNDIFILLWYFWYNENIINNFNHIVQKIKDKIIFINTEGYHDMNKSNDIIIKIILKCSKLIIDYSYENINYYVNNNIKNYVILPFAYSKYYEIIYQSHQSNQLNENISDSIDGVDILFYGSLSERRKKILLTVQKFALKNKYTFLFTNNIFEYKKKIQIISKSKIILSIKKVDSIITNDLFRLGLLISNKKFFIAESYNNIINDQLKHFMPMFNSEEDLIEKISYFLNNEEECKQRSENLYNYCINNLIYNELE